MNGPSLEAIQERLTKRGTETEEVIQKRINNARREIERGKELDYYQEIINDDLNTCFATLVAIIEENYGFAINH